MEFQVELVGADHLIARLGAASERIDPKTVEGLVTVADRVVDSAKFMAPVDTGSLQRSIRRQHHVSQGHVHSVAVTAGGYVVNPKTGQVVNYAAHVEYGTRRIAPQPYMNPALEMNRSFLQSVLMEKTAESLR